MCAALTSCLLHAHLDGARPSGCCLGNVEIPRQHDVVGGEADKVDTDEHIASDGREENNDGLFVNVAVTAVLASASRTATPHTLFPLVFAPISIIIFLAATRLRTVHFTHVVDSKLLGTYIHGKPVHKVAIVLR